MRPQGLGGGERQGVLSGPGTAPAAGFVFRPPKPPEQ